VRGDGPKMGCQPWRLGGFSPRAWGWSETARSVSALVAVLPTCVGMVRRVEVGMGIGSCSPHVRGDGPQFTAALAIMRGFSPRAWGWSEFLLHLDLESRRSPHVRGDGPGSADLFPNLAMFSPRAWGWSEARSGWEKISAVLPTCVGMVRLGGRDGIPGHGSPHVRGDGPEVRVQLCVALVFSPRAWGWSDIGVAAHIPLPVLPTCVGMVRRLGKRRLVLVSSPHVRGDGPKIADQQSLSLNQ